MLRQNGLVVRPPYSLGNDTSTWKIVEIFPANTVNPLLVTFNDDNGAITLGSFDAEFRTGAGSEELFQITSD